MAKPVCVFAVLFLAMALSPSRAADVVTNGPSGPQGDTYASIAKLPDWSGQWELDRAPDGRNANNYLPDLPLTPLYKAKREAFLAVLAKTHDVASNTKLCIPVGALRVMMRITRLFEFLDTPGQVTVIPQSFENRRIYTDGRGHQNPLPLSFNGDTIGHWENGTLVADTAGLRPEVEFPNGKGLLVGDAGKDIHMAERIYNIAPNRLQMDVVVTSPSALTAPYKFSGTFSRTPYPIMEEVCQQNNLSIDPLTGKQTFPSSPGEVDIVPSKKN